MPKYNSAGKRATERPWETGLMARWLG